MKEVIKKFPLLYAFLRKIKDAQWVLSKPLLPYIRIKVESVSIYLNPNDDVISKKCLTRKKWESSEVRKIQERISKGSSCIDIGANIGIYTCIMSNKTGKDGKVFAFEPSPENYSFLKKNSCDKKNVVTENMGVSDVTGESTFFISEINKGDHRLYQPETETSRQKIKIKMVALSEYLEDKAIAPEEISVIKMDTQGAEPYILQSMETIIKRLVNTTFFVEFWPPSYEEQKIDRGKYLNFLFENFKVSDLNYVSGTFKDISSLAQLEELYQGHLKNLNNLNHSTLMLEYKPA